MDNVIRLNRVRKRKRRAQQEAQAQANRLRHGQSKETRERSQRIRDDAARRLDAHQRDLESNRDGRDGRQ